MGKEGRKKGHGGERKHGRNKVKCERYRMLKVREKNKVKRVLRSEGMEAALAYGKKYGVKVFGVK
jgi:hypothetical protein